MKVLFVVALALMSLSAQARVLNENKIQKLKVSPLVTQGGEDPDPEVQEKRNFVRNMLKDSWDDYEKYAWGQNELKPISQTGQTGGIYGDSRIGATIIDALDTLHIMGFDDEFKKGRDWIAENFDYKNVNTSVSLFETNIRIVGGFLTAFALTGDELFKQQAYIVGKQLLPAFDSPSKTIPYGSVNPATGVASGNTISLAELGTLHLEFIYLSQITGDPIFAEKALAIQKQMNDNVKPNGLYPNDVSSITGQFAGNFVSMGGGADSFYEYLVKSWIQTGDRLGREMYDKAMDAFVNNDLVRVSKQSNLVYIAETRNGRIEDIGSHLECFAGAMFAIGAYTDPRNPADGNRDRDMEIGKNFTNTCHESYIRSATKIGPETFRFTDTAEAEGVNSGDKAYRLRPEVIESYFILYRLTKDNKYREWAWEAAQSIEKYCKAGPGRGYSGLNDVYSTNPGQDDVQQTFFLAETLKYLYLIFSSDDLIDLDSWVFNTECHPLPVKGKNPMF